MLRTILVSALAIICVLSGTGAAAQTDLEPSHPIVGDVLRMMESEVAPDVIVDWLETVDDAPSGLTADDLILLTKSGAPEPVLQALMAAVRRSSPRPEPATPAPDAAATPTATAVPDAAPAPAAGVTGSCCLVYFSALYNPSFNSEDDVDDEVGALHFYVDGNFLGSAGVGQRNAIEAVKSVGPGEHTIRLMIEEHTPTERGNETTWTHKALVAPEVVHFELDEAADWKLEVEWSESMMSSSKGPLSWGLLRDGKPVAGESQLGSAREQWSLLCEDVEANVPPGQNPPRWVQRDLGRCVRWDSLWPDVDPLPNRADVRKLPPTDTKTKVSTGR